MTASPIHRSLPQWPRAGANGAYPSPSFSLGRTIGTVSSRIPIEDGLIGGVIGWVERVDWVKRVDSGLSECVERLC